MASRALSFTIPALRLAGFLTLSGILAVRARTIGDPTGWPRVVLFSSIAIVYSALGWALLWRLRRQLSLKWVGRRVAEVDVLLWAYAIALTGGPDSGLFPLMTLRAADHVTFGKGRVLFFGHLSTLAYTAVLLQARGWNPYDLQSADVARLMVVYGINVYLYWAAGAVDRLNARLRSARDSLSLAKRAAEESSRAKSAFLAAMSHELRTPLTSIIGYTELIKEERDDDPALHKDLERIHSAGIHLLGMVNDVLDLSKIDAGKMEIARRNFDVSNTARLTAAMVAPMAESRSLDLNVDAPGPVWILADETRVRQVLLNLLSNACKFTDRGYVRLSIDSADTNGLVTIRVEDTGIGMTAEQTARIFDEFVQVDDSPTRRHGGTGLGLTLTRRFTEMMGGSVHVASQPGLGSTFSVRLPAGTPAPDVAELASHSTVA